jgi:hypothetical protein
MQEIFGRVSNISPGGDTTMRGFSRFYRRLGKAFEDIKVGNDDPNVAAVSLRLPLPRRQLFLTDSVGYQRPPARRATLVAASQRDYD